MNFRLGPRDKTDHPDWLPVSLQAVLFGTLAVCLMGFFLELPLFFIAGPIILALFIILPLPRFVGGLLITLLLIGLVYLEQHHFPSVSAGILLAASIGILGTLLRETLLKNEWKFAALSLWQAIDESKASSGEIIAGEVLKSVRQLVRNDITIALRELDPLSADIYISDPPDVFPLKILPPDIYKKSSANNEILFINNYDAEQEQNRYLKEIGAQSLVIVPLRYSGKIRGAVLLIWRRKNAISAFMQNFLELIFERLYASLTIADASHRLDKLQAQYDAILKTMPQGVAFVDENGAQNWVNHAAAKLLDIKEGPVEPKDFAMAMAQLRTSADNIKEIVEESMQLFKTKNASIRDWEWDFSTMRDQIICVSTTPANSETSAGRLWIFEDVTDRKRAEEAVKISNRNLELSLKKLEILNEQLVELNKEKNEFLGIAAHDLKNPLSAILGLSNILLEDSETITPQETQEYTKMIVDSAER
ncbi:MAG TPA: histidine kinase dimerization/phospho-acceptor domain-containing protein, partial [Patescibacteria group bacterium]|nr:histidine kinase dimerization/phospho-acceptor domain-containing protein [Patescibacteria group bacterium]